MHTAMLWIFKLATAPVLVALMSLAARRWGPTIGGLIMGLPWMTGPVIFVLAIEKGDAWAARAVVGVLLAVISITAFVVAYTHTARRMPWPVSLAAATAAFAGTTALLRAADASEASTTAATLAALASLWIGTLVAARPVGAGVPGPLPWWDIPARMLATFCLVCVISVTAEIAGPGLSGIVSSFPVIATVIGTFTHHRWGADALTRLYRALLISLTGFVGFFWAVSLALPRLGLATAFAFGAAAALAISAFNLAFNRWRFRRA